MDHPLSGAAKVDSLSRSDLKRCNRVTR